VAPYHVGAVTDHQSMDCNPSSPRVPGNGRGCMTVSWRLVSYDICTEIGRYALLREMWVDFPYLICVFCVGEITSLISFEKMSKGSWWATPFLLPSLSHGVARTPVCLLWESRHSMLVCAVDRWAKPPLSARVALITGDN
jgi:hypothetical protein